MVPRNLLEKLVGLELPPGDQHLARHAAGPSAAHQPATLRSWDSDHEVIVVFGGEGSSEGTLVYDPFANTWTHQKPENQPAFRSGGNMTYDVARKRHILFGSQFSDDSHTWAYDLTANRWTDLKPKEQPPTDRNDAVLTYDPEYKTVLAVVKVSTGEEEKAVHRLETWAYHADGNTWTKLNPPANRTPAAIARGFLRSCRTTAWPSSKPARIRRKGRRSSKSGRTAT